MKIFITETKEFKTLTIKSNGVEWTGDLLGNHDVKFNADAEAYEMTQEDFNWWSEYIESRKADEQEVTELAEELKIAESEIWDRIQADFGCDLGDEHMITQNVLAEIKAAGEL
jgi:hypothetical protein